MTPDYLGVVDTWTRKNFQGLICQLRYTENVEKSGRRDDATGKISVFARQREIARTRESATAAEGGTHVYLNRKMVQELLAEIWELR